MVNDDSRLARLASEGDEEAFETIVRTHEKTIYNVAYRMVRSHDDALDITQTVFIKAYRKLHTFKPGHKLFSWLYRIAVNESISHLRRSRPTLELDGERVAGNSSAVADVERAEASDRISAALLELSVDHRVVVVLKYFLELSYREISEIVGIPEKTVKSRLYTAREKLRGILIGLGVSR